MNSKVQNGMNNLSQGAHVLDDIIPEDAARAMIEGRQTEPFFLFDMDEANRRIQHFKEVMPRVQIFYAMKANDWDLMLKLVVSQGLGFDCASPGEISKVLKLGVNPLSIIFALPTKTPEQMKFARDAGVQHTTFDSSCELKKLKQHWPEVNLLIRIRVDGESVYKLGDKFGCDFQTEARNLLEEAAALGFKVAGVAFHVGSICSSIDSHTVGLKRARDLFDYEKQNGRHNMKIVDIGGGFLSGNTQDIDQVAKFINKGIEEYFPEPNVQIVAEPGRYICDSAATLYNSVCSIRQIMKNNKPVEMVYINDGLHGTLRYTEDCTSVERLHLKGHKNIPEINQEESLKETILWGPTCDSTDRVMKERIIKLPQCSPFDWLVFRVRGAYSYGYHGPFSCVEIPKMRPVISKELWEEIKDHPVFTPADFVLKPDLSAPLPSSLPPIPSTIYNPGIKTNVFKV